MPQEPWAVTARVGPGGGGEAQDTSDYITKNNRNSEVNKKEVGGEKKFFCSSKLKIRLCCYNPSNTRKIMTIA